MCLKFLLKDDFESLIYWLDHWLSCMLDCIHVCVFHISKNWFEKLARPLLDTLLSVELLQLFLIAFPTASRYLVDRSRKLLPPRYLLDRGWIDRDSVLAFDGFFLDTSSIPVFVDDHFLDTCLDTFQYLHLSSFTDDLYVHSLWSGSHFFDLSQFVRTYSSPKHYLSHYKPCPLWFFKLFQNFLLLVSF